MSALTLAVIPVLLVVAALAFVVGFTLLALRHPRAEVVLWVGLGGLVTAAALYVVPMLVLGFFATPI